MSWFKKAQKVGTTGHPVTVNPPPGGNYERNVARISRLKVALQKLEKNGQKDTDRYELLKLEMQRRIVACKEYKIKNRGVK